MLAARWRRHYNAVGPHSAQGYCRTPGWPMVPSHCDMVVSSGTRRFCGIGQLTPCRTRAGRVKCRWDLFLGSQLGLDRQKRVIDSRAEQWYHHHPKRGDESVPRGQPASAGSRPEPRRRRWASPRCFAASRFRPVAGT